MFVLKSKEYENGLLKRAIIDLRGRPGEFQIEIGEEALSSPERIKLLNYEYKCFEFLTYVICLTNDKTPSDVSDDSYADEYLYDDLDDKASILVSSIDITDESMNVVFRDIKNLSSHEYRIDIYMRVKKVQDNDRIIKKNSTHISKEGMPAYPPSFQCFKFLGLGTSNDEIKMYLVDTNRVYWDTKVELVRLKEGTFAEKAEFPCLFGEIYTKRGDIRIIIGDSLILGVLKQFSVFHILNGKMIKRISVPLSSNDLDKYSLQFLDNGLFALIFSDSYLSNFSVYRFEIEPGDLMLGKFSCFEDYQGYRCKLHIDKESAFESDTYFEDYLNESAFESDSYFEDYLKGANYEVQKESFVAEEDMLRLNNIELGVRILDLRITFSQQYDSNFNVVCSSLEITCFIPSRLNGFRSHAVRKFTLTELSNNVFVIIIDSILYVFAVKNGIDEVEYYWEFFLNVRFETVDEYAGNGTSSFHEWKFYKAEFPLGKKSREFELD